MMSIQLRAEWSRRIDVDLICDDRSTRRILNLPSALVVLADGQRLASTIFRADPVHVLAEVTNLIQGVPNGELQLALRSARRQNDFHFYQMLLGRGKSNGISNRGL